MRDMEFRIRVGGRDFWVFRVWGGGGGGGGYILKA